MKRWILVLIPLLFLGGLITWRLQTKKAAAAVGSQQRDARRRAPATVSVVPAEVRNLVKRFESIGTAEAPLNTRLSPEVSGRITFLQVQEGDRVRRGQVLVRLDASELQAQVAQRRAALAEERHRLAQAQISQAPTDASVATDVQQKEAELASAEAHYRQAVQNYEAQLGAAQASVTEMQGRVEGAAATIANAEAAIRSAQANLDNALAQQKRVEELYQQGYIAAQDLDDARAAVSVQRAALDAARSQQKSAAAAHAAALAQQRAAEQQAEVVKTKGKADIEAARAEVARAKAALQYARANRARKPAYRANLAALQAAVDAAQASLETAETLLSRTVVRSPIDGFVTARHMDPGAVASPNQPVLEVQAIDPVWVTVPVPEEVQQQVRVGTTATVTFDALPGRRFTARVEQVSAAVDVTTRQFPVRLVLANPKGEIKPGMFARVSMITQQVRGAVVVPQEAVQERDGSPFVVVVDENQVAHHRPVSVGASDSSGVVITRGLQPGEQVVVVSAMPVQDGQEVRVGGRRAGAGSDAPSGRAAAPAERRPASSGPPGASGPERATKDGERR